MACLRAWNPSSLLDQRLRTDGHDPSAIIELEIQNLRMVQESVTSEMVGIAVQRLLYAEHVYVLGMRSGFGVAHSCWHLLQPVLGPKVELVTLFGGSPGGPVGAHQCGRRDHPCRFP